MVDLEELISDIGPLPGVKTFNLADQVQPIENYEQECPAVLLYHGDDKAKPSSVDNHVSQTVEGEIAALIICDKGDVAATRKVLMNAMLGRVLDEQTGDAVEFKKGVLLDIKAGIVWREDKYMYEYLIREE